MYKKDFAQLWILNLIIIYYANIYDTGEYLFRIAFSFGTTLLMYWILGGFKDE